MEGTKVDPDNGHDGLVETGGERRGHRDCSSTVYKPISNINLLAGLPVHSITMDQDTAPLSIVVGIFGDTSTRRRLLTVKFETMMHTTK